MPNFDIAVLQNARLGLLPEGDALTARVLEIAAEIFRRERRLVQHFILYATLPEPAIVAVKPNFSAGSDPDNHWVHAGVREVAATLQGRAIFTVSEVWVGNVAGKSLTADYRARNDPNRKESAMVMVENPKARPPMQLWQAEIERSKGRPRLREWKPFGNPNDPKESITGRLTYLLPREAYGKIGDA